MWLVVMFDLPTGTKKERKAYSEFRKLLIEDGFTKTQYSVYSRYCSSQDNAIVHIRRVTGGLPPGGEVRILEVTEKQFEKMRVFWGRRRVATELAPEQLQLF